MKFRVNCPKCQTLCTVEVDTGLADNGDVYHDTVVCDCREAFLLRTEIRADTTVLAVSPPEKNADWLRARQVKKLLAELEKHLT